MSKHEPQEGDRCLFTIWLDAEEKIRCRRGGDGVERWRFLDAIAVAVMHTVLEAHGRDDAQVDWPQALGEAIGLTHKFAAGHLDQWLAGDVDVERVQT